MSSRSTIFSQLADRSLTLRKRISALSLMIRDWPGREIVEEALRRSEERFRVFAENADDTIFIYRLKPEPFFEYLSPAVERVLGHKREDYYQDPQLICGQIVPADLEILKRLLREPNFQTIPVEIRWIRPDENLAWTELKWTSEYNSSGEVFRVQGIARDVTARKIAEEEKEDLLQDILLQRKWLQTVFDHAPVGVLMFQGAQAQSVRANRQALTMLSLSRDQFALQLGGKFLDRYKNQMTENQLPWVRARCGKNVVSEEGFLLQPEGEEPLPISFSACPIHGSDERIVGVVCIFEDRSALKELEQVREEWNSLITHDLRQPITGIQLQSEMLLKIPGLPEMAQRLSQLIRKNTAQLSRMTHDLLDVSRLEARNLRIESKELLLEHLVKDFISGIGHTIQGHPIRIKVEGEIPKILGDPGRLEQVLGNLLTNAGKYGFPGTEIQIELKVIENQVQLAVINHGQGIEEADLAKLFQRFHRTHWSQQANIQGIGLGLYIAKGLVEAHGGRILAASIPGKITTFSILLPVFHRRSEQSSQAH